MGESTTAPPPLLALQPPREWGAPLAGGPERACVRTVVLVPHSQGGKSIPDAPHHEVRGKAGLEGPLIIRSPRLLSEMERTGLLGGVMGADPTKEWREQSNPPAPPHDGDEPAVTADSAVEASVVDVPQTELRLRTSEGAKGFVSREDVEALITMQLVKYEQSRRGVARAREANLQRLWSQESVAEVLDVPVSFVTRLIRNGDLKCARLGHRTLRIKEQSLRAYLRKVQGT